MREAGLAGEPEVVEVTSDEDASLGYRGSPSVVIDGADVDAGMTDEPDLHYG
jgi:hypothetical protein